MQDQPVEGQRSIPSEGGVQGSVQRGLLRDMCGRTWQAMSQRRPRSVCARGNTNHGGYEIDVREVGWHAPGGAGMCVATVCVMRRKQCAAPNGRGQCLAPRY